MNDKAEQADAKRYTSQFVYDPKVGPPGYVEHCKKRERERLLRSILDRLPLNAKAWIDLECGEREDSPQGWRPNMKPHTVYWITALVRIGT